MELLDLIRNRDIRDTKEIALKGELAGITILLELLMPMNGKKLELRQLKLMQKVNQQLITWRYPVA